MTTFATNLRVRSLDVGALLVVLFAFTATPAMGQIPGVDFKPGVRAGVNFTTWGGDGVDDLDPDPDRRTGFLAGAFVQLDFAGPFALQPELLYIQKGAVQESTTQEGTTVTRTFKLDYIEIPVLAKFQFPLGGPFSPNLFAGPSIGFSASAEAEDEVGGRSGTEDISDRVSSTEFGLIFGVGGDFGIGAATITVDARYGLGLTSVDDGLTGNGDFSLNNQGFMFTAGFAF